MSGSFLRGDPRAAWPQRFLASLLALTALVAVVAFGAAFRLTDLGNRPMHCDEAVHAIKFGRLLEDDDYVYDPKEYHGPSLNYLTLPIAYMTGKEQLTEITETDLRLLPAVFGIALIGLVWLLRNELGTAAILWAAVFTAVSPAMVFYSRYYIQEMLLITFTFGAIIAGIKGVRHLFGTDRDRPHLIAVKPDGHLFRTEPAKSRFMSCVWLAALGVCLGMMHASKETCVIAIFCIVFPVAVYFGLRLAVAFHRERELQFLADCFGGRIWIGCLSALVVLLVAAGVSMMFFSSFFANPGGIVDSMTTYFVYLGRSSGEGSVGRHVYPWHYYLSHLFWFDRGEGRVWIGSLWTELSIALLALVGLIAGAMGKGFDKETGRVHVPMVRLLGVYTVLMTLIYSALPYKTPWCALGFLHGMILLAGVGAAVLIRVAPQRVSKSLVVMLLIAAVGHLAWQAHRASFVAFEDPKNPYVYSHTTNDVPVLCQRVEEIARLHPDGRDMHIQVLCPDADHWPLPWYLRHFTRIGWYAETPEGPTAPLIIMQPVMADLFLKYNYAQPPGQQYTYMPFPREKNEPQWQLRPHVPLQMYMRLKLHNQYVADREEQADP
ncbi:MAG: flippase activity-associated protein Agl23 [Thermoguttaceae bacterium]